MQCKIKKSKDFFLEYSRTFFNPPFLGGKKIKQSSKLHLESTNVQTVEEKKACPSHGIMQRVGLYQNRFCRNSALICVCVLAFILMPKLKPYTYAAKDNVIAQSLHVHLSIEFKQKIITMVQDSETILWYLIENNISYLESYNGHLKLSIRKGRIIWNCF